ncbi:MAG: VWA domain-containing protein [Bacteroidales bacterium]|nr:VWA domain-containing protein [Bacteroidales bacterium]MDP2237457.1 VWA domain-containing protein [Bacteroidales bacterium]
METNILKFERPEMLYLLLIIPVIIAAFMVSSYFKNKSLKRFAEPQMLRLLMPLQSATRPWIKLFILIFAYISLIVAIANPQTGSRMEEVKREGIDIFIALDVSNSMLAEDIAPNRLERSKQAVNRLIDKLTGDRIGIIVFAGKAYVQLPITTDYAAARLFLSTINTDIVPTQGTAIAEAIQMALSSLDVSERNKAIIIISDGEDHEEDAVKAAKQASDAGVYVYTIGMGLADGAPIPIYNKFGKQTGFRKDKNNNTIITRLNEGLMQQIAAAGNGTYVRASNIRSGLETIFNEINSIAKSEIDAKVFTDYENRFQLFLGFVIILLLAESLLAWRKSKWESKINLFEKKQIKNE